MDIWSDKRLVYQKPTLKQVEYANKICNLTKIPLPVEESRREYGDYIARNQNKYKRMLQSYQ